MEKQQQTKHHGSERGHETRDANFKSVVVSGIGLLGLMLLGLVVSFVLLALFKGETAKPDAHPETFVQPQDSTLPPAPNLQSDPHAELVALRAREDSLLTTYGYVGHDSSVVRVPIERAMQLMVNEGLPTETTR